MAQSVAGSQGRAPPAPSAAAGPSLALTPLGAGPYVVRPEALSAEAVVLDANITLGWCFGRRLPADSRALLLRVRGAGALAPRLLQYETERVIARRAGGRSLSAARAAWFRAFFCGLPIAYELSGEATGYAAARTLAESTGLTVKDAAYLELAQRAGRPLATRDRPLAAAARRLGVAVV